MRPPVQNGYLRSNYILSAMEGGFFMGGMTFLSMESVMPTMIHDLGGPAWAVSMAPVLFIIGFGWPQIFSALWVERLKTMKPIVITFGTIQRLPYLLTGLFLLLAGENHPQAAVVLAFLTPFIMSSLSGIQGSAYFELVTRIVPVHRIASMWAIRNVMMAGFGVSAGFVIKLILDTYPAVQGYGILHLITFSLMMISIVLFSRVKEMNIPDSQHLHPVSFRTGFASFASAWRNNPSLGRFILSRMFSLMVFVAVPFLAIRAIDKTGGASSLVGLLVLTQMIGFVLGNVISGYFGDRFGARILMLLGRTSLLLAMCLVPFAFATWHFLLVFVLVGFGLSSSQVGDLTIVIDFAPSVRRKFYYAVMGVLTVPGVLLASLLSARLQYLDQGFYMACLVSSIGVGVSLLFLISLEDPRHLSARQE